MCPTLKTFLLRPGLLPYPHPHVTGFLLLNLVCVCVHAHTHITMCTCASMYAYVVGGRLEARDPISVVPWAPPMRLVRQVLLMGPRCSRIRLGWAARKHQWSSCLSLPSSCRFSYCLFCFCGCWEWNSSPRILTDSTLATPSESHLTLVHSHSLALSKVPSLSCSCSMQLAFFFLFLF